MKIIQKYKTNDGKEFASLKEAEDYLINKTCEDLDRIVKENQIDIRYKELYKLCLVLYGDYDKLVKWQKYFNDLIGNNPYIVEADNEN